MFEPRWSRGPWDRGTDEDEGCPVFANGLLVAQAFGPLDLPCYEAGSDEAYNAAIEEVEANQDLISAAPEMYEALELEEDRDRMRHIRSLPPDERTEQDYAECAAIPDKWRGRYPSVFAACKPFTDEWAILAKHLRDKSLAKARGEATP
jgi:hypothetical protein